MNTNAAQRAHVVLVAMALLSFAVSAPGADGPFVTPRITETPAERVELRVEAEEFDGLRVFPDFHRQAGQGWYVKEHAHASGRAFTVCDAESAGAAMVKRFERVYPAGQYVVAVRGVLTRWRKGFPTTYGQPSGNALKVELGMVRGGDFAPVAALPVRMLFGSGYGFVPAVSDEKVERRANPYGVETIKQTSRFGDPVVTAAGTWNALRVTAESIISGGIGDVPEFGLPFAAIDAIKVTNAPGYAWSTSHSGRIDFVTAAEIAERAAARAAASAAVSAKPKPSEAASAAVKGNLVADGSFEAGGRPWWNPALLDNSSFTFDQRNIMDGDCPHGRRFARLAVRQNGPVADEKADARSYTAHIRSRAFPLPAGEYVASCVARTNKPGAKLLMSVSANVLSPNTGGASSFELTAEWKRFEAGFKTTSAAENVVFLSVAGQDRELYADVDAVQVLPKGTGADRYREAGDTALLVACPVDGNTYWDDEPVRFEALLCNETAAAVALAAEWRIMDTVGSVFASGEVVVSGPKGMTRRKWVADFKGYGDFVLAYTLRGSPSAPVLIPFARVQAPPRVEAASRRACYLGVLGRNIREDSGRLLRRYGIEFKTDLSDTLLRAPVNTYGYHKHYTFRNEIEQTRAAGLQWVPWIFDREPAPYDRVVYAGGPAAHGGGPSMSPAEGAWYIADVLTRYKGLHGDMILVTDEFSNHRIPRDGLEYLPAAYKAAKSAAPDIQVMNSVECGAAEAIAKALGGVKGIWADWLGGSRYGMDKWMYAREARFIESAGVRFYIDGVGWSTNQAGLQHFDSAGRALNPARQFHFLNEAAWDLAQIAATLRPDRFSCYTTKYGSAASDPYNQFALFDGRLTPVAALWVTLLQFLREADRGGILIPATASNIEAVGFRIGEMNWAALYARAPALLKEVELALPADQLTILDLHLLPRPPAARFVMRRGEMLLVGSRNPGLPDAVIHMKSRDLLEERHAAIATPGGGTQCVAMLRNNSTQRCAGDLTLFANMLTRTGPQTHAFDLGPGEARTFAAAQAPDTFGRRAIAYYPVHAALQVDGFIVSRQGDVRAEELQEKEGMSMRSGAYYWTHNALRMPPAPDGAPDLAWLDDWQKTQSPASVYVNWGLNGSYQRSQVRRGGENGRIEMDLDGYMPPDFMSLHYVRYDDRALYIGALIEDQPAYAGDADPRTWGESVVYSIVPDLERHLGDHAPAALRKVRVVQTTPDRLSAVLAMPDGSEKTVQGVCRGGGESRRYLVRVPFSMLGFSVGPGATCGFGISCADSDGADGRTRVEYDWSGAPYAPGDAFGFGQLLVR